MSESSKLQSIVNLEFLRKEAKSLLKSCRAQDKFALQRVRSYLERLKDVDDTAAAESMQLADIQHALARESGFPNWAELKRIHAESGSADLSRPGSHGVILGSETNPWRASVTYTIRPNLKPNLDPGQEYRILVSVMGRAPSPEHFDGYASLYWRARAIAGGRAAQLRCAEQGASLCTRTLVHGWFTWDPIKAASAYVTLGVTCVPDGQEHLRGEREPMPEELTRTGGTTRHNYKPEHVSRQKNIDEAYTYVDFRDESEARSGVFLISYGEYLPSSDRIDYQPFLERAESLAGFHVPFLDRHALGASAVRVIRREWFCTTSPDMAVVHIYLRI